MSVTAVNQLMKQYSETRKQVKKMMAQFGGMDEAGGRKGRPRKGGKKGKKGKKGRRGGMPGMGGMSMADLKKIQSMLGE